MKITFQAFKWNLNCAKVSLSDMLGMQYAHEIPPRDSEDFQKYVNNDLPIRRVYIFKSHGSIYNGLVVTIKNVKHFCTLTEDAQNEILETFQLDEQKRMVEINFFVFDAGTSYGLYQHYRGSCSLSAMNMLMKNRGLKFIHESKMIEFENDIENGSNVALLKKLSKEYKCYPDFSIIERAGTFEQRIKMMKDVDRVNISILDMEQPATKIFNTFMRRASLGFFMSKTRTRSEKINAVFDIFDMFTFTGATVAGIDEYNREVIYKSSKDFDRFATYEYDELVSDLSINIKDAKNALKSNSIVKMLYETYESIKKNFPS